MIMSGCAFVFNFSKHRAKPWEVRGRGSHAALLHSPEFRDHVAPFHSSITTPAHACEKSMGQRMAVSQVMPPSLHAYLPLVAIRYVAAELQETHVWANITRTCHCIDPAQDQVIFHDNDFEVRTSCFLQQQLVPNCSNSGVH